MVELFSFSKLFDSDGAIKEFKPADREQFEGQLFVVVDASVHGHEPLQAGLVFHVGVVQTRVEHDDGKRQDVAGVCNRKPQLSFPSAGLCCLCLSCGAELVH